MSLHLGAQKGQIADIVLLSGDPSRAKYIADNLLQDSYCYTRIRNMLGFTGTFNGTSVSIQGTGMGQASLAIYVHELIQDYDARTMIRVGTCGAIHPDLKLGDIVIAQGACTDASFNKIHFQGMDFAPIPSFRLLRQAADMGKALQTPVHIGNVFSTDLFYAENDPQRWKIWADHGILCADMETAMLYTMAIKAKVAALSILTVSDHIIRGDECTAQEREKSFLEMAELALRIAT
ncbi:MAG: purine-nucleoside phosphorylase [Bacteroidota bacterium]